MSHDRHNNLYGLLARFEHEWNPFEKKSPELHNPIASITLMFEKVTLMLYGVKDCVIFAKCSSCCAWISTRPCLRTLNTNLIAFSSASCEGCMLLVWMHDKYTINTQGSFCHFYIYILMIELFSFQAIQFMLMNSLFATITERNI